MQKVKKIKIILGLIYLIILSSFLILLFSKFSLQEIGSYDFIKNNRDYFFDLKNSNLILLSLSFFIGTIIWVFLLGFGSPLALIAGFIFGKWLGIFLLIFGMSFGATILYTFGNYFLKDIIKEKFSTKFKNLEEKFKKSEFIYLLFYRFIGGVPFGISNLLPCIFNVKASNFFWATLLGLFPQLFLIVSLGSGLEKIIDQNLKFPSITDLIFLPEIYQPIGAFIFLILITYFLKRIFYDKKN